MNGTHQVSYLQAAQLGDLDEMRRLHAEDPAVGDARDDAGRTAVARALFRGQAAAAELAAVLRSELDVWEAAMLGRACDLRRIVDHSPGAVSEFGPDGFQALHLAAFFGHPDSVSVLLQAGAALETFARGPIRVAALHAATASQSALAEACVALLLEAGADPNAVQDGGFTPLHAAAQGGSSSMVSALLSRGADATARTANGQTPADLARDAGHDAVAVLLDQAIR